MVRWIARTLVVAAAALIAPQQADALPEDPGTTAYKVHAASATLLAKTLSLDLYVPAASAPAPAVVLGHGFARNKGVMAGWGKLLASRGYVAAAPNFPGPLPDHTLNGKLMSALLGWMVTQGATSGTPLSGRVDGTRRAVMGHSAGGLAALLAASADKQIDVVIGLDPVDVSALAQKAAPAIAAPVVFIRAQPGACNSNGNAAAIYKLLKAPRMTLTVVKATHCDPELPSGPLCTAVCGGTAAPRQARFRRYAMAALDHVLRCDKSSAQWLGGSAAKGDALVSGLDSSGFPPNQLGCAAAPDAGLDQGPDVGTVDGATQPSDGPAVDSAPGADGLPPTADAGDDPEVDDSGCGCGIHRCTPRGHVLQVWLLLAAVLGVLVLRVSRGR